MNKFNNSNSVDENVGLKPANFTSDTNDYDFDFAEPIGPTGYHKVQIIEGKITTAIKNVDKLLQDVTVNEYDNGDFVYSGEYLGQDASVHSLHPYFLIEELASITRGNIPEIVSEKIRKILSSD